MGAVQRLSSKEQLAMTAKNGLASLVVAVYLLCISCQPCQGDESDTKDLFKRNTRDLYSYFWPTYETRSADSYWWYYPKRAPGSEFLGKRVPGSEFFGKRVPGSEFLGKRVPGSEFLGKRSTENTEVNELLNYLSEHKSQPNKRSFEVPLDVEQRNDRNRFESSP